MWSQVPKTTLSFCDLLEGQITTQQSCYSYGLLQQNQNRVKSVRGEGIRGRVQEGGSFQLSSPRGVTQTGLNPPAAV